MRSIAVILSICLASVSAVALAIVFYMYFAANRFWERLDAGRRSTAYESWEPRLTTAEGLYGLCVLVAWVLTVAVIVALAVWMWRSIAFLERRGDYSVGFGRSVAVWSWFVPLVNLIVPPLVLYRLARALGVRSDLAGWGAFGIVLIPVSSAVRGISGVIEIADYEADLLFISLLGLAGAAWLVSGALISQLLRHLPDTSTAESR